MERVGINGAALTSELCSAREELPVELDFVLPDDCPDVAKILRGSFRLGQNTAVQTDGGILAEGSVCADVWYIADTGNVFRVTGRTAFSKKMNCELLPGAKLAPAAAGSSTYCNARTINQRRIECKGAVLLRATYTLPSRQAYMTAEPVENLEISAETHSVLCPVAQTFARVALEEERPLPEELPDPAVLLRWEGTAVVTERKQIEGKLMLRGEMRVALCCAPAEGTPFQASFPIPFSQLIELEGLHENTACDVCCELLWCDAALQTNEAGQKRTVALRGETVLTVAAHETQELNAAMDAFGLKCRAEPSRTELSLPHRLAATEQSAELNWVCDPPVAGASAVLGAWGCAVPLPARRTEEGLSLPVRVTVFGLLLDQNERPTFLEKSGEVVVAVQTNAQDPFLAAPHTELESLRLVLDANGISCGGNVRVQGTLYDRVHWNALDGVELDTDAPLPPAPTPLAMFWAADGVSVWELAKQYAVPLSALHMQDGFALVERM